jgi:hypothetical protein
VLALFRYLYPAGFELSGQLSLVPAGGILALIGLALPVFVLCAWAGVRPDFRAILLVLIAALAFAAWLLNRRTSGSAVTSLRLPAALTLLFAALLALRLAFVRDLVLPPYSDSIEHYQIINDLLHPDRTPQAFYGLLRLTESYYHFGFHALAGSLSALSGAPAAEVMLALGQILQAVIPLALFFVIQRATGSDAAGLFGVLLAGIAWRMPGFASNWGKYPALTALALVPLAFGLLLLVESSAERRSRRILLGVALGAAALTGLSHTRGLLLLGMAAAGWWAAGRLVQSGSRWMAIALAGAAAGLAWTVFQASRNSELAFMLSPYLRQGFYSTLLVMLLAPFGLQLHPRAAFAALLFLMLMLAGASIPLPDQLARYGYQTLVDRPFAQMSLFLPLTLVGAVGFAGLAGRRENSRLWRWLTLSARLLVPLAIALSVARLYDYSPSACCQLAGPDDMAAFEWMQDNLPRDSVLLIAANRTPARSFGVDGGAWIAPITGLRTEKWPFNSLLDEPSTLEGVCAKRATHIYVGGTVSHFAVERIAARPEWYVIRYQAPAAAVYEVVGCPVEAD